MKNKEMRIAAGLAKGLRIRSPSGLTRPTSELVREAIFNVIGPMGLAGSRILDLYAGTGTLGIEALSRGASWADFVEVDRRQCSAIRETLEIASFRDSGHVYCARVEKAMTFLQKPYMFVFLDPPYAKSGLSHNIDRITKSCIVTRGTVIVVEHSWLDRNLAVPERAPLKDMRRYGDTCVSYFQVEGGY